jgi:adenylate kinase family enzyme
MLRVSVIGTSCSGKTSLARRIASAKNIRHVELDAIHWLPNWTPLGTDEFRAAVQAAAQRDEWVIDGNYSKVRDIVWARATDVVWLNLPLIKVLWRAVLRTTRRVTTKEELFGGNRETLRLVLFDRDSILWWVLRTHRRRKRTYEGLLRGSGDLPFAVHEIRNARDETRLLEWLSDAG